MKLSLFERIKNNRIELNEEYMKITGIIHDKKMFYSFNNAFQSSIYNVYAKDYFCALEKIINNRQEISLDIFLQVLEFYKTLCNQKHCFNDMTTLFHINSILDFDCEKLGYKFVFINNEYKTILNDEIADSVALSTTQTTREKIYSYLILKAGMLEEKRMYIKSLADDIENMCNKYSIIQEYSKLKQFIQCVRHTKEERNDQKHKQFPFYYNDEEKWLDKIFQMIIGVLAFTKAKEITNDIINEENNTIKSKI